MKHWTGVGESGASQRFPERIISHIWVEKKCTMDGASLEEEVGDDIWRWDRARKFKVMIHGRA